MTHKTHERGHARAWGGMGGHGGLGVVEKECVVGLTRLSGGCSNSSRGEQNIGTSGAALVAVHSILVVYVKVTEGEEDN